MLKSDQNGGEIICFSGLHTGMQVQQWEIHNIHTEKGQREQSGGHAYADGRKLISFAVEENQKEKKGNNNS